MDISASGTIFQYQGELSQNILNADLNIFDGWVDPVTKKPYGYAVNLARNKFQIIWFLENQESVANISQNTAFADNSDKYVKSSWDALGILLDEINNEVIIQSGGLNQVDIENDTANYSVILEDFIYNWRYVDIESILSQRYNSQANCRSLLKAWLWKKDWVYTINPTWIEWDEIKVYCNMTTNGWGWTLAISQMHASDQYPNSLSPFIQELQEHSPTITSRYSRWFDDYKYEPMSLMVVHPDTWRFKSVEILKWCWWEWMQDPTACGILWVTNLHRTYAEVYDVDNQETLYFSSCSHRWGCEESGSEWWWITQYPSRTNSAYKNWWYAFMWDLNSENRYSGWMWWNEVLSSGQETQMLLYFR